MTVDIVSRKRLNSKYYKKIILIEILKKSFQDPRNHPLKVAHWEKVFGLGEPYPTTYPKTKIGFVVEKLLKFNI